MPSAADRRAHVLEGQLIAISSLDETGPVTESEFAVSDGFIIHSTTGVGDAAVSFALLWLGVRAAWGAFAALSRAAAKSSSTKPRR